MTLDPPSPAPTAQAAAPGQRSRRAARVLVPLSIIAVAILITIAWLVALIFFARWLIAAAV